MTCPISMIIERTKAHEELVKIKIYRSELLDHITKSGKEATELMKINLNTIEETIVHYENTIEGLNLLINLPVYKLRAKDIKDIVKKYPKK